MQLWLGEEVDEQRAVTLSVALTEKMPEPWPEPRSELCRVL